MSDDDTTVTCVGKGCVSIPLGLLLLCFACFWRGRVRRVRQRREMLNVVANTAGVPSGHYYYAAQEPSTVPVQPLGYVMPVQPSGCVVQQPGYAVQGAPRMVVQGAATVGGQPQPMCVAQPVMAVAQPVSPTVHAQPPHVQPTDEEVPMGRPVS